MQHTLGLNGYDYVLPGGGVYHCNGVQAVAYARNRYVGNSDYARTERQRYVISQIIEDVKRMDVAQLTQFVKDVLPSGNPQCGGDGDLGSGDKGAGDPAV